MTQIADYLCDRCFVLEWYGVIRKSSLTASLALIFVENEMVLEDETQLLDLCQCATELQKLHLSQPETIYSEKEV